MSQELIDIAGVSLVADNLYKVLLSQIQIEKTSLEEDLINGNLGFFNPRSLTETFDHNPVGCNHDELKDLRNSIQERGLLTPLIGRVKNNKISLINGHRRLEAIKQLIEDNEHCYDFASNCKKPAAEVFCNLIVKIFDNMNEIEANVLAFEEDKTKVKFGAGSEYKFVQHCMNKEISEDKIIKMTGNNQQWLESVKSLLNRLDGDAEILDALFSNRMNISAAKKLAQFDNIEDRTNAFKNAYKKAEEETVTKKIKQEKSIINTKKKIENVLAEKHQAVFSKNEDEIDAADALIETYRQQEEQQKDNLKMIGARVTGRNVTAPPARANIGKRQKKAGSPQSVVNLGDEKIKVADMVGNWLHPFENMKTDPSNTLSHIVIDYSKELIDSIIDGTSTPEELVQKWSNIFVQSGLVG